MKALLLSILFSVNIFSASSTRPAKAFLMADAFSSIADGTYAIFYNPALLNRNSGLSFHPFNTTLMVPNALTKADDFDNIGSDPSDIFELVSDFPIRIGYSFAPGFQLGGFGFSAIVDNDSTVKILNEVNPVLDMNYKDDRGFAMGYAFGIDSKLSFGASLKYIKRESIDQNFSLTSTTMLDILNGGDLNEILNGLGKVNSQGWSIDAGLDYVNKKGATTFMSGVVIKDFYNTISAEEEDESLRPIKQKMAVNLSAAMKIDFASLLGLTFSVDYKNLLDQEKTIIDKFHLGTELQFTKALSILAGYNARAASYGTRLNLGLIDFYLGFTEERLGSRIDQGKASGIVLYLSLLDFKFEP